MNSSLKIIVELNGKQLEINLKIIVILKIHSKKNGIIYSKTAYFINDKIN